MNADRLRVAVVGAGDWGAQHARIFAERADTDLVGVLGRRPDRTAQRAAQYATTAYTDLDTMIDTERPDLVTACLPNREHYEITLRLIRRGVPLLVEKPLVFDLEEADRLLAEADRRGLFFAINFNHRFAEPVLRAKQAIDEGLLGEITFASWRFGGEGGPGASVEANLVETSCHGFDLLEHLAGPITSVMAQLTSPPRATAAVACEFANGAVGTLLGSYDTSYAYPDTSLVEVNGTSGRLVVHDTVRELELSLAGDPVTSRWRATYFDDEARSFARTFDRHVDAVLAALRSGHEPPVHARAGRRALALALAAITSARTGERVPTPPV